jgi:hypothetical protein
MRFQRVVQVVACGMSLAAVAAPQLQAQQVAPRLRAPAPPDSSQATPPLAPLSSVATGGFLGGIMIGGATAAIGAMIMAPEDDDFISSEAAGGVIGFALGYPIGVALGARHAAAPAGHRPSGGLLVLTSALTAGMGGLIWYGTGRGADVRNPEGDNIGMWYIGAAAGSLFHLGATSYMAWRGARRIRERAPAGP